MPSFLSDYRPMSKELNLFVKIFEANSISKAAKDLQIDQGGLSRKLRSLEKNIGTELFLRTTNGLVATKEGKSLYLKTREVESTWSMEASKQFLHTARSILNIGVEGCLSGVVGQKLVSRLTDQASFNLNINFSSTSYALIHELLEEKIDFAISSRSIIDKDLESIFIGEHPLVLVGLNSKLRLDDTVLKPKEIVLNSQFKEKIKNFKKIDFDLMSELARMCLKDQRYKAVIPLSLAEEYFQLQILEDKIGILKEYLVIKKNSQFLGTANRIFGEN